MQNSGAQSPAPPQYRFQHGSTAGNAGRRRRLDRLVQPKSAVRYSSAFPEENNHSAPLTGNYHTSLLSYSGHDRRASLPQAAELAARAQTRMGPPPKEAGPGYSQHRMMLRRSPASRELSLKLPPLRPPTHDWRGSTSLPAQSAGILATPTSTPRSIDIQARTPPPPLEVLKDKLSIMKNILLPSPRSSARLPRVSIIAVEGDNSRVAQRLSDWLAEYLGKCSSADVTVVDSPSIPEYDEVQIENFPDFLDFVNEWYQKTKDIIRPFTLKYAGTPPRDTQLSITSHGFEESEVSRSKGRAFSQGSSDGLSMAKYCQISPSTNRQGVMLLRSYVLTATNKFASRIPPTNGYSGRMHWEWAAGMWRGAMAPDLVVYIMNVKAEEDNDRSRVEVLDEGRLMAIKRCTDDTETEAGTDIEGIASAVLRRLGFEIAEQLGLY
ncbi:hypothetical protein ANO11243_026280 [Dothideomycetidae sp. 11243]|nr:hypothetical protein ANO11243_026280 [fungal sp. No.11243]